jgi:hypothetical protein
LEDGSRTDNRLGAVMITVPPRSTRSRLIFIACTMKRFW